MNTVLLQLPILTLLDIWSELEQAYHGEHGYGGDTAEIYAYRLLPDNPIRRNGGYSPENPAVVRAEREAAQQSYATLRAILTLFAEHRECEIEVDGQPLGLWNKAGLFEHRAHVRVARKTDR